MQGPFFFFLLLTPFKSDSFTMERVQSDSEQPVTKALLIDRSGVICD